MNDGWSIVKHYLDIEKRKWVYTLKSDGGKSFLDDCVRKDPQRAKRIANTAERIFDRGVSWALCSDTIKAIKTPKGELHVFEAVVRGTTIRVATYLHRKIPIYLFEFTTHQGRKNNLPQRFIDRAIEMSKIAAECVREYDFNEYGEHEK